MNIRQTRIPAFKGNYFLPTDDAKMLKDKYDDNLTTNRMKELLDVTINPSFKREDLSSERIQGITIITNQPQWSSKDKNLLLHGVENLDRPDDTVKYQTMVLEAFNRHAATQGYLGK